LGNKITYLLPCSLYQIIGQEPERKKKLVRRPKRKWEYNNK